MMRLTQKPGVLKRRVGRLGARRLRRVVAGRGLKGSAAYS